MQLGEIQRIPYFKTVSHLNVLCNGLVDSARFKPRTKRSSQAKEVLLGIAVIRQFNEESKLPKPSFLTP
jgi:hypothetical protein